MAVNYDVLTNKITITGYSALTPCNFTDLYNEDKLGTLDLWTGTPTTNIILTIQIKPSDELALKIDFILVGSGAGAGDTIVITGTDKDDNVQNETLTTTADGTFTTTKWFKTITDIDCNGFNSGTLTVRQNQWGVIGRPSYYSGHSYDDNTFVFGTKILTGTVGNHGYFADIRKLIKIEKILSDQQVWMEVTDDYGHVTFGEKSSVVDKTGYYGIGFIFYEYPGTYKRAYILRGEDINLYGCKFQDLGSLGKSDRVTAIRYIDGEVYNCQFYGAKTSIQETGPNADLNNIDISGNANKGIGINTPNANTTMTNIRINGMSNGFYMTLAAGEISIIKNTEVVDCTTSFYQYHQYGMVKLIDVTCDDWNFGNWIGITGTVHRQYILNLQIVNENGANIDGASIRMWDKLGNLVVDEVTLGGVIPEQTLTYGHYNQAGGNIPIMNTPHYVEIRKRGYLDYKVYYSVNQEMHWVVRLRRCPYNEILGLV